MSDILESAKEHFKSKDIKRIEIPEWETKDGKPFVIYAKPLTLAEKRRLSRDRKSDDVTLFADVLLLKAEDDKGNKIFKLDDKHSLMHSTDPDIVARVANQILDVIPVEDWEKKNQD
jgi:hypothetical protein